MFRRLPDSADPDRVPEPVRPLIAAVGASVADLLRSVASGPNAEPTWARVRQAVAADLTARWREGAVGATPDRAFFVRCDRSTMTQGDIDAGRLVCLVGVAPVRPAEFVVLRITQMVAPPRG